MGDETKVKWQVQLSPLAIAENRIQATHGAQIMIPSTVKDVSIKLTHMPDESPQETEDYDPVQEVDYQVPIVESKDEVTDNDTYKVSSFVKNPDGSLADDKTGIYGVQPSSFAEQPDWDFYQVYLNTIGIFTFEVTGSVESVGDDTYVPIRADNMLWRCASEGGANDSHGVGSAMEGCVSLKESEWAQTGELPPVTTKEQSEDTRNKIVELYKKQGKVDGLTGVGACAVTQNTDRFDTIGSDIEDAAEGKHHAYRDMFNLHLNPTVRYYGPLNGDEDNCDQGFQHITLCPDEEPEVPPSKEPVESEEPQESEEPTPSEEPQESEEPTPSEDPEKVGPAKPSKESEESQESGEPTSSKKMQEPGESTSSEEPVSSESKFVPSAQSDQGKPADSKPESKPESKTVISESVKDNVAKQAKTVAKKDRPKVTTGGHLRVA
ncbi:hypothetical protein EML15_02845 [Corynebacterium sp. sy017]|uniref:hypothetical protein n=1 Tax=unclassified Corynebacterium TaxID=2624378 RepID=UPI001184FD91|nr:MULTISPECIES: hypothetical protein [unclassified Corynebacterium]MBP3088093.1 hypothetical protein [Corynebacterium sp. sy017]TSD92617.1 hypothetical protein ELY17_02845 [Corynebacterium sp. SY003]